MAALALVAPGSAAATPVSGPHETIDSQFTTTQPGAPTGFVYTGRYHAANDPSGDPPYMRKMISTAPPGLVFDTNVPDKCTASDLELAIRGVAACPAGSKLATGTAYGKAFGSSSALDLVMFNNTNEQIIVVQSPFFTSVSRGAIHPDGSVEFASPTCYPALNPPGCATDNALQTGSDVNAAAYTRTIDGVVRSYETTPPTCPATGHWEMPVHFWWSDGTDETVVTQQACARSKRSSRGGAAQTLST